MIDLYVYICQDIKCWIRSSKTHGIVCHNLSTWQTSMYFTHICSLTLPEQKQMKFSVLIPLGWAPPIPNLSQICQVITNIYTFKVNLIFFIFFLNSSFSNTFWNCYSSCMLWLISLKIGALLEHIYDSIFVAIG